MYDPELGILLLWHIGSVVIWLGATLTFSLAISPTLRIRAVAKSLFLAFFPRFSKLLGISSVSTIIAGTMLFGYVSSTDTSHLPLGWGFIFITIGAVLGLIATIITLGAILPQGSKFVNMSNSDPSDVQAASSPTKEGRLDEESMLRAIDSSLKTVAFILSLVLTFMIIGTYI